MFGSGRFLSTYDLKVRYPYKEKDKEYIISIEAKEWVKYSIGSQIKLKRSPKGTVMYAYEPFKIIFDIAFGVVSFGGLILWGFFIRIWSQGDYKKRLHNDFSSKRVILYSLLYFVFIFVSFLINIFFKSSVVKSINQIILTPTFLLLFGANVLLVCILIQFLLRFYWPAKREYKNKIHLIKTGKEVQGTVTQMAHTKREGSFLGFKYKQSQNEVKFEFPFEGKKFSSSIKSFIFLKALQPKPGDIITIFFNPSNPSNCVWKYR